MFQINVCSLFMTKDIYIVELNMIRERPSKFSLFLIFQTLPVAPDVYLIGFSTVVSNSCCNKFKLSASWILVGSLRGYHERTATQIILCFILHFMSMVSDDLQNVPFLYHSRFSF